MLHTTMEKGGEKFRTGFSEKSVYGQLGVPFRRVVMYALVEYDERIRVHRNHLIGSCPE